MDSKEKFALKNPCTELTCMIVLTALTIAILCLSNYKRQESTLATTRGCNLFAGQWVYDDKLYPPYEGKECSFMLGEFACEKYGRKNLKYQKWRWQPRDCDLPRFDGKAFLEKIRGKKLYFVGDSLNRNQWNSLLCLIESSLSPSSNKVLIREEHLIYFEATDYNATIGFYWSPFLVESNSDNLVFHYKKNRIVRIKAIEKHARHWTDADILIFDSYAWWTCPTITFLWGSFGSPDSIYKQVENRLRSYEMALNTWSDWLEININRTKTKLFFMSLSPTHMGDIWAWTGPKYCYNETEPILKEGSVGMNKDVKMMHVVESTLQKLEKRGLKVQYLNITRMSEYRKDAHPGIYKKFSYNITKEQLRRNPSKHSDCLHWCLPGLPDTWNEILYAYIMNS